MAFTFISLRFSLHCQKRSLYAAKDAWNLRTGILKGKPKALGQSRYRGKAKTKKKAETVEKVEKRGRQIPAPWQVAIDGPIPAAHTAYRGSAYALEREIVYGGFEDRRLWLLHLSLSLSFYVLRTAEYSVYPQVTDRNVLRVSQIKRESTRTSDAPPHSHRPSPHL
jgi:hypothetical protein